MISKKVQEAYDNGAHTYATVNPEVRGWLVECASQFAAMLQSGATVLDLGCGAGRDMAWLEGQGIRLVGADLSAGMLGEARKVAAGPLVQMDMRQQPFAGAAFDGVWCMASMLHLPRSEAPGALAEVRRVLKPGGVLLLGLKEGSGEAWEPSPYGEGMRFFARYSLDEAAAMLAQAGFTVSERQGHRQDERTWLHLIATRQAEQGSEE